MTMVGVAFIALGILASVMLAWRTRSFLYVPLFFAHLGAAFFYWQFTLYRIADAWSYYHYSEPDSPVEVGTSFVAWLTANLRELFSASYVDMFMIFHLLGYSGVVIFSRLLHEAFAAGQGAGRTSKLISVALFIPGLHVWTSAIGKDALVFLGIASFFWGVLQPTRRFPAILLGFVLCFLIRPHIALMLVIAAGVAVALSSQLAIHGRFGVFAFLSGIAFVATPFVLEYVGLRDPENWTEYVEQQQNHLNYGGSGVDISEYSFPMQVFTYMYRPLFFDATNALSFIVSFENLFYLLATLVLGSRIPTQLWRGEKAFFLRLNFFFWMIATSMLAMTTSNLGLAVRQKTAVVLPSFLVLICAAYVESQQRIDKRALTPNEEGAPTQASPRVSPYHPLAK